MAMTAKVQRKYKEFNPQNESWLRIALKGQNPKSRILIGNDKGNEKAELPLETLVQQITSDGTFDKAVGEESAREVQILLAGGNVSYEIKLDQSTIPVDGTRPAREYSQSIQGENYPSINLFDVRLDRTKVREWQNVKPNLPFYLRIGAASTPFEHRYVMEFPAEFAELPINDLLDKYVRNIDPDLSGISQKDIPKLRSVQEMLAFPNVLYKIVKGPDKIYPSEKVSANVAYTNDFDPECNLLDIQLSTEERGGLLRLLKAAKHSVQQGSDFILYAPSAIVSLLKR